MTALAKNTPRTKVGLGLRFHDPVAAATQIFAGAMVALDASGNALVRAAPPPAGLPSSPSLFSL